MPPLAAPPAPVLVPAGDRRLVEQAVVDDAVRVQGPEMLVRVDIPQPDGSMRLYAAWTGDGEPLADRIDQIALGHGVDAWSWVEILRRTARTSHRGRIEVRARPLRQVLADIEAGFRGSEQLRAGFARLLAVDAARAGQPPLPAPGIPAWAGVGPRLWHQHWQGRPVVERHWLAG
ncbi:hypothetical protein [Streptomyces tricolor]|uniref:hypothetical protein n=1 Tax=Streptomyces tricolor TaxID=68277 RepID=UPI0036EA9D51